jgi:hypothetical protein
MAAILTAPAPVRVLPTRDEAREMLRHPGVAATAIVMIGLVVLSFVGAVVFLSYNEKPTEAIGLLVITPVIGLLLALLNKLHTVQQQTNGTTNRLLDAALPAPAAPTQEVAP